MNLFQLGTFTSAGLTLDWKIECDCLQDKDIQTLAKEISNKFKFGKVEGVPTGGLRLAEALKQYSNPESLTLLIVDDVFTTGKSMEAHRAGREAIGVVIFNRSAIKPPEWIFPMFSIWR